jgi:hypothetical protein
MKCPDRPITQRVLTKSCSTYQVLNSMLHKEVHVTKQTPNGEISKSYYLQNLKQTCAQCKRLRYVQQQNCGGLAKHTTKLLHTIACLPRNWNKIYSE